MSTKYVFGVAATFIEKHRCHVFGYCLNTIFCLWEPLPFAFKPQDNQKQHQAAFCVELQTVL
jgi:hypothetical protein